jgi:hypothetical protein
MKKEIGGKEIEKKKKMNHLYLEGENLFVERKKNQKN